MRMGNKDERNQKQTACMHGAGRGAGRRIALLALVLGATLPADR
jgi:hypothetical protein